MPVPTPTATVRSEVRFWLHDPTVHAFSDAEIDIFCHMAEVPDSNGRHVEQPNYIGTWDVMRAAGYGWLWMAGLTANAPLSYTIGDVTVNVNQKYCNERARELMGSTTSHATRRDEPWPELFREVGFDGDNPRHRS